MATEDVTIGLPARKAPDDLAYQWRRLGRVATVVAVYDPQLFSRRVSLPPGMDLWSLVATVATPTLLQYGGHSDVVNVELATRLQRTMPNCTVERVEEAGHGLFTDQPDVFAASVERFIEGGSAEARFQSGGG